MYPNQRIQGPFGDIYQVNSPYLDKLSDRLYNEEKQAKIQGEREAKALDDEFSKNMANIRDADVPELAKAYGDWKLSNKALIKNKKASPEEQLAVLRKKADMYKLISESKAFRKEEELHGKGIVGKRYNYIPGAHGELVKVMRTPLSQMDKNTDPLGSLLYQGSTYKKGGEDIKNSLGVKRTIFGDYVPVDKDGIQTEAEKYEAFSNTPEQVKQYYLGKMADPEANYFYSNQLMNLPENALTEMQAKYDAIPDSHWKKLGVPKPVLEYNNLDSNADTLATYKAQEAAVQNLPQFVGVDRKTNMKAKADAANREWDRRRPLKLADQKELLATREQYKNASEEKITKDVSAFIQAQIDDAVSNPTKMTANDFEKEKKNIPGVTQIITPYKIRTSPVILEVFSQKDPAGNVYKPTDIYYNPEKKTIVLKGGEKNGSDREITTDEYQAALVNKVFNTKTKLNQINTDETVAGDKKSSSSGSSSTKKSKPSWAN